MTRSKSTASGQVEGVSAQVKLLAAQAGLMPDSPWENLSVGVGPAHLDLFHLARNLGWHPFGSSWVFLLSVSLRLFKPSALRHL